MIVHIYDDIKKYPKIRLCVECGNKNNKMKYISKDFSAHLFVFIMFADKRDVEKYINGLPTRQYNINHIDGVKQNNHINNLELITPSNNIKHAINHGLINIGEYSTSSFDWATNELVKNICDELEYGMTNNYIIRKYNLRQYANITQLYQFINSIYQGNNWKHISRDYNFYMNPLHRSRSHNLCDIKTICKLISSTSLSNKEIAEYMYENNTDDNSSINTWKQVIQQIRTKSRFKEISDNYF